MVRFTVSQNVSKCNASLMIMREYTRRHVHVTQSHMIEVGFASLGHCAHRSANSSSPMTSNLTRPHVHPQTDNQAYEQNRIQRRLGAGSHPPPTRHFNLGEPPDPWVWF